ncbi:MAG: hypothetical protein VB055_06455 [Oscillospiraceae bacterium]|nr:hypothetical protein [Oscillospiraceae bacterium]
MKKLLKILLTGFAVLSSALFVIYFWNLDQKLMAWVYTQVNRIFDRKKVETKF